MKRNFLPFREFRSLPDANGQLKEWILGPAGNRIHGTTRGRPLQRFVQTERHLLRRRPPIRPEPADWAKVHGDCHVQYGKCRYSVPFKFVRQELWLRASETAVRVFRDQELVAVHA